MEQVASPSFNVNLQQDDDDACELGDSCSFGELAVVTAGTSQPPSPHVCHAEPEPMVEEALRCNDSDEAALIKGNSDNKRGSHGSNVTGEFHIGQIFQSKDEALLALKNYSIRRGVEYRVLESDHEKYHGKCKEFGKRGQLVDLGD
ncbi:hypothetical protein PIB30_056459 [Stylosanthes scabra]|uniref:Transposase MuDR plant domain-containing protein n=1 Tax=Stylosanthes scabra TaxID=79078 RepID=A0ABU6XKY3_9FABA|nr:hypothetical protein [Stylosanthes scabra]